MTIQNANVGVFSIEVTHSISVSSETASLWASKRRLNLVSVAVIAYHNSAIMQLDTDDVVLRYPP